MAEIDYVQEGANLKINSAYKSIMKESKTKFHRMHANMS